MATVGQKVNMILTVCGQVLSVLGQIVTARTAGFCAFHGVLFLYIKKG
jgi:hypothetical protein